MPRDYLQQRGFYLPAVLSHNGRHSRTQKAPGGAKHARRDSKGVARRYCGTLGKVDNCHVAVSPHLRPDRQYRTTRIRAWRQIHSTNPLERLNRGIGRRADVVAILPNRLSVLRLIGAVHMEQSDEWAAATRRYFSQESMAKIYADSTSNTDRLQSWTLAVLGVGAILLAAFRLLPWDFATAWALVMAGLGLADAYYWRNALALVEGRGTPTAGVALAWNVLVVSVTALATHFTPSSPSCACRSPDW